jgi:hypothetical protein
MKKSKDKISQNEHIEIAQSIIIYVISVASLTTLFMFLLWAYHYLSYEQLIIKDIEEILHSGNNITTEVDGIGVIRQNLVTENIINFALFLSWVPVLLRKSLHSPHQIIATIIPIFLITVPGIIFMSGHDWLYSTVWLSSGALMTWFLKWMITPK